METEAVIESCNKEGCKRKKNVSNEKKEGRKEIFYLTTHSTHCIYCYMASDIW